MKALVNTGATVAAQSAQSDPQKGNYGRVESILHGLPGVNYVGGPPI